MTATHRRQRTEGPRIGLALGVAFAVAQSGCAVTARTSIGPSVSPAGGEERVGAALGVGLADDRGQLMLLGSVQPGTKSIVGAGGVEYDRDLRGTERPLGIRVRVEGGVESNYAPRSSGNNVSGLIAVVPGVWWMPFHTTYDPHRFVMAIEPRIGVAIPAEDASALGPFFDVAFVLQWEWVPCTFFGSGSCRDLRKAPVLPTPPPSAR